MATQEFTTQELEFEEWRDVVGYEGVYSVSNLGRVRRDKPYRATRRGKIISTQIVQRKYRTVALCNKNLKRFYIHKLVAAAFIGPRPEGQTINHIDGDKLNNRPRNLEYLTHKENMEHASRTGLIATGTRNATYTRPDRRRKGSNHGMAKLTDDDVRLIRTLYRPNVTGFGCPALGKRFGVGTGMIWRIVTHRAWTHLV